MNEKSFPSLDVDYNMCEFCSEKLLYILKRKTHEPVDLLLSNLMHALKYLDEKYEKHEYFGPKFEELHSYIMYSFTKQHNKPGFDLGAVCGMLDCFDILSEKE